MKVKKMKTGGLKIRDTFFLSKNPATHVSETEMIVKPRPDYYSTKNLIYTENKNVDTGGFGFYPNDEIFKKL